MDYAYINTLMKKTGQENPMEEIGKSNVVSRWRRIFG